MDLRRWRNVVGLLGGERCEVFEGGMEGEKAKGFVEGAREKS